MTSARKLEVLRAARGFLARLPEHERQRIMDALDSLSAPSWEGMDIRKLAGRSGYRLRVGRFRVIFEVDPDTSNLLIRTVRMRGNAYKR